MTASDDLLVTFKVGSHPSPYSVKDGGVVSVKRMDDPLYRGLAPEHIFRDHMRKTFAIARMPRAAERMLLQSMQPKRGVMWRGNRIEAPITSATALDRLAGLAGDASLERRWRSKADVVPVVDLTGAPLRSEHFRTVDEVLARPLVRDVNAVSSGSYTVGTAQNYADWVTALADIDTTLTGALTFTQKTATSETTGFSYFEPDLAGYTLLCTSDTDHLGLLSGGWKMTVTSNGYVFRFRTTGTSGTLEIKLLNFYSSSGGQPAQIQCDTISSGNTIKLHNMVMDLDNTSNYGIDIDDNSPTVEIWLVGVIDASNAAIRLVDVASGTKVENCTFRNPANISGADGFDLNLEAPAVRNVAVEGYTNAGDDFIDVDNATGYNNASSDTSAANVNWGTGSGNQTNQSSSEYGTDFAIPNDSNLNGAGTAPQISGNTAGINGTSYGTNYPIGAWMPAAANGKKGYTAFGFVF